MHEPLKVGNHGGDLGLLQHDFRDPHTVGCWLRLPGQVPAPVLRMPVEHPLAEADVSLDCTGSWTFFTSMYIAVSATSHTSLRLISHGPITGGTQKSGSKLLVNSSSVEVTTGRQLPARNTAAEITALRQNHGLDGAPSRQQGHILYLYHAFAEHQYAHPDDAADAPHIRARRCQQLALFDGRINGGEVIKVSDRPVYRVERRSNACRDRQAVTITLMAHTGGQNSSRPATLPATATAR